MEISIFDFDDKRKKDRFIDLWKANEEIYLLLKNSENIELAREKLIRHLEAIEWAYRNQTDKIESWHYILLKESLRCFKNIISKRNEIITGNSSLEFLWRSARFGESDVSDDFIAEFVHLFRAMKKVPDVYPSEFTKGLLKPDFKDVHGRESGILRSNYLDQLAERIDHFIDKYPSGLDEKIRKIRSENKERILGILDGSQEDWEDWQWHFKNVFKDHKDLPILKNIIYLDRDQEIAIKKANRFNIPYGITPHYLHLMDQNPTDRDFAIRKQVFPPLSYVDAMVEHKEDRIFFDFMREQDTTPKELVTRRYPKVAILKPYDSCPQICVYCQRNWEITSPLYEGALASKELIDEAINWFGEHHNIMDVLLTGGDPLVMKNKKIEYILNGLTQFDHIKSIRIATRIPVTVPQRIDDDLVEILSSYNELGKRFIYIVTHVEHPYEITPETASKVEKLKLHNLPVYNQQVFTFANSRRFETVKLRMVLKLIGIDPYYNFNMKGKSEMEDYAVPVARILQERKEEARLLPGIYRTDEPVFNVPMLGKNHLRSWQDHELISILPNGSRIYSFHPWEKNIETIEPFLYTDVSILRYLKKLEEERGEDKANYKSIWYYY
jgi:lysine 2,3-aminomutase